MELDPTTDDFFFLASDGLFDKYSSKDCVKLIQTKLRKMDMMEQCA